MTGTVVVAPGRVPLAGHIPALVRDPIGFVAALGAADRGLVRVDAGTWPVYFATAHETAHEVLTTSARSFVKGSMFRQVRPLAGDGLATSEGALHRSQRRLMQPSLHGPHVAGYAGTMSRRAYALAGSWHDGQTVDLGAAMYGLAMAIAAETLLSLDVAPTLLVEVSQLLPEILRGLTLRALLPPALLAAPLPGNRRFSAAMRRLRAAVDASVAIHGARPRAGNDLLSVMVAARDPETGAAMSDRQIRDEIITVILAGTDTTATTIVWALHEIATHPDVERRLLAELDAVLGGREVRHDDLVRLPYTRQVLDEVLRIHSGLVLTRTSTEAVVVGGHPLPAGTEVAISPYVIHRDPRFFPDPEVFDPDRWDRPIPHQAFLPFGRGNRKCIGDSFAWTEVMTVLAAVCSRWRLSPAPGYDPRYALALVPRARRMPMTLTRRVA